MNPENAAIALVLTAMAALPVVEALLRRLAHTGVPDSTAIVQHLTLLTGMLGAAIAARDKELMPLSSLNQSLSGRWRIGAEILSASCATAVSFFLFVAGTTFVSADVRSSQLLAGIPIWIVEAVIPAGFALIAFRIWWRSADSMKLRLATLLCAAAVAALGYWSPLVAMAVLGLAILAGAPAFVALAGVTMLLLRLAEEPIASIPIAHYSLVTNPILPTIPLFTLTGYLLAESGAPGRLVRVFQTLFSRMHGGAAVMTACVCAFFTSFTGGSGVTIIALGALLMPVLLDRGFKERDALGMVTGAGSLGLLFPPCVPLILFACVAKVPIEQMFLGGLIPGTVMLVVTALWGISKQGPRAADEAPFDWTAAKQALWVAKWELMIPVVALGTLFGGFATSIESAALTALYALSIEVFVYRDLSIRKDIPRVMAKCGLLVGGILLIQGVALGFTDYLVDAHVMSQAADWAAATIHSRWLFLLSLNAFLLIVGCLMEIYAAIIIQAPLLVAIGKAFGLDPVHLGIIFLANLELGYLTPPVGLNLILSSYRFNKPITEVFRASLPLALVLAGGVLLITYVPALTVALPHLLDR